MDRSAGPLRLDRTHKSRMTAWTGNSHQRNTQRIVNKTSNQLPKAPSLPRSGLPENGTNCANPPVDGRQIHPIAFCLEKTMARHAKLSVLTNSEIFSFSLGTTRANGCP